MKKSFINFVAIFILFLSITACGTKDTQGTVSEALSLDVSSGQKVSHYDTHSGNGDGISCTVFCFDDNIVLTKIQNSTEWNAFPLDETVETLVYGIEDENGRKGPYLTDEDGRPLLPEIQNGYYLLIDRQVQSDEAAGADILHRSSFNFDLGLYDADTNMLYFCQLDT